jgi:hypothetical protein
MSGHSTEPAAQPHRTRHPASPDALGAEGIAYHLSLPAARM